MISEDKLRKYAENLEFTMNEKEYKTLKSEFDVLLKKAKLIDNIEDIKKYEPMSFPFPLEDSYLREDNVSDSKFVCNYLSNCKCVKDNCVVLPKVVD